MLSVEVFTAEQQLAINVFSSRLIFSGQKKFGCNDREMRSNQKVADDKSVKIIIEYVNSDGLDDQVPPHSPPIQCCSPNIDGELVIATNQPFSWSSQMIDCEEHQIPCKVMKQHHQQSVVTKRNTLATMQDGYNVNCEAVQESYTT